MRLNFFSRNFVAVYGLISLRKSRTNSPTCGATLLAFATIDRGTAAASALLLNGADAPPSPSTVAPSGAPDPWVRRFFRFPPTLGIGSFGCGWERF